MPSPSPTITRAVKLKRRPPLTTLATRLIATTRSRCGVFSAGGGPPPPPRRLFPRAAPVERADPLEVRSLLGGRVTATALAAIVPAATFAVATGPAASALLTR